MAYGGKRRYASRMAYGGYDGMMGKMMGGKRRYSRRMAYGGKRRYASRMAYGGMGMGMGKMMMGGESSPMSMTDMKM